MLTKLAVWYLRKKNVSVLVGYELMGGYAKAINSKTHVYDNNLDTW